MTLISRNKSDNTCLGRTCLKWDVDGSLSDFDRSLLMQRLCADDPEFSKSDACRINTLER